ncbi:pyridoxal-phosphate dependent enzyme [Hwanghaeella grinnelliae]|uniref:Pyridoxal-phosphate dependent enzyme n=1 Tax=Hwanghaeella grinnelliae TaxID=2500179 RepID=A0A3S2Y532_9PROT|nr:pyridoxal-phosphate dependent enzyme [Hwanghaeella grinnelliae]RVU38761.1 pyridoxal-phosphate dependent enzyme [Hwanghaeella grinnelliae]
MRFIANRLRGTGLPTGIEIADGEVCTDATAAMTLYKLCPAAQKTPLTALPALAAELGLASVFIKDERERMGLGSFKALGAAHAIAKLAAKKVTDGAAADYTDALKGETFVCASAGNHGLSVAAGARVFGANAAVYLADPVPEDFADRLRAKGADVVRAGATYEESMEAAARDAAAKGWRLLSDSSWIGYTDPARDVMEGYLIMAAEAADDIPAPPTHIFLQAGVGGLAAACTAMARQRWGDAVHICVVEPEAAPALIESIEAGKPVTTQGSVSSMGRLDCKEPSHLALKYLAREADGFMTVTEAEAGDAVALYGKHGIATSPSAAAALAGLVTAKTAGAINGLGDASRILLYVSEGEIDD